MYNALFLFAGAAMAFPSAMQQMHDNLDYEYYRNFEKRDGDTNLFVERKGLTPIEKSVHECNTGLICSTNFDSADQFVDVRRGKGHGFIAPKATDLRGECPGLNAAANHGFLPRNGIATIEDTVFGLGAAYNMGPDLAGFLAVAAIALSGDFLSMTWSIGGAYKSTTPGLSEPQGILGTHNKYEGDASICRGDAYLHKGEQVIELSRFRRLIESTDSHTLDTNRKHNQYVAKLSETTNPHYFSAPFSGLVTPAAHEFVINFMSNHSAEKPSGYLDNNILRTFFAVSGPVDNLKYTPGYERIPLNWYRRPSSNPYTAPGNLADTALTAAAYPNTVRFGGNTGKVNSFTGVDISNLTGGVLNGKTLFQGNNLGCFAIQALQGEVPDQFKGSGAQLAQVLSMLDARVAPLKKALNCPQLKKFNLGLFSKYPGYRDPS